MGRRGAMGKECCRRVLTSVRAILQRIPSHVRPNLFGAD